MMKMMMEIIKIHFNTFNVSKQGHRIKKQKPGTKDDVYKISSVTKIFYYMRLNVKCGVSQNNNTNDDI